MVEFTPGVTRWVMKKGLPIPVILWLARPIRSWIWSKACHLTGVMIWPVTSGNGACSKMLPNILLRGLCVVVHG